eukprot:9268255-Alexandrium_andersonii.AAC.1
MPTEARESVVATTSSGAQLTIELVRSLLERGLHTAPENDTPLEHIGAWSPKTAPERERVTRL